jgi:Flp pilus assembly protein TadB
MIASIGISIFGLMIGRRIFAHFDQNQIFSSTTSQKLWNAFIYVHVLMFFLLQKSLAMHFCFELVSIFFPFSVYVYQDRTRRALFRDQAVPMLDILILQMRSGRTLREAIGNNSMNLIMIQFHINELNSLLQFGTDFSVSTTDPFFSRVANELLEIHRSQIKTLERLKAFRSRIKTEQDFRQRARQATLQVRLQAGVLLFLYLGLVTYISCCYPWARVQKYFLVSLFLFIAGLCALLLIPRRFKWKI